MTNFIDLTGQTYGRLKVIKKLARVNKQQRWLCECDCGKIVDCQGGNLRSGQTRSCGCLSKEIAGNRFRTHGMSKTSEFYIWHGIRCRCHNKSDPAYKWYGALGVTVCDQWRTSFEAFIADVGFRPSKKHSLDRINPYGNYEPSNCRWATWSEQASNKRNSPCNKHLNPDNKCKA